MCVRVCACVRMCACEPRVEEQHDPADGETAGELSHFSHLQVANASLHLQDARIVDETLWREC